MAKVITQSTTNTGTSTFSDVNDFILFINDLSIFQQAANIFQTTENAGDIISRSIVQQAPNVFVHTRKVISEEANNRLEEKIVFNDGQQLLDQLGWTLTKTISYEYD